MRIKEPNHYQPVDLVVTWREMPLAGTHVFYD
jgi:hypothetical protein